MKKVLDFQVKSEKKNEKREKRKKKKDLRITKVTQCKREECKPVRLSSVFVPFALQIAMAAMLLVNLYYFRTVKLQFYSIHWAKEGMKVLAQDLPLSANKTIS